MSNTLNRVRLNREQHGLQGFTLIELLIVIVVLGILAAIVVFALGGVTDSSAVSACNSDAKTVSVAVSAYEAQNGSYPAQGLVAAQQTLAYQESLLVPTYLKSWPSNASSYSIGLSTDGQAVTVALKSTDAGMLVTGTPLPADETTDPSTWSLFEADNSTVAYAYPAGNGALSAAGVNVCAGA